MRRLSPSVIAREELDRLLEGGAERETNIVSELVERITRLVIQELLEAEQTDFLGGRGRYQRRGGGQRGSRNGYERGRVRTAEGAIEVGVPKVRGAGEAYRSSLMGFWMATRRCWIAWSPRCTPEGCPPGTWRTPSPMPPASY